MILAFSGFDNFLVFFAIFLFFFMWYMKLAFDTAKDAVKKAANSDVGRFAAKQGLQWWLRSWMR